MEFDISVSFFFRVQYKTYFFQNPSHRNNCSTMSTEHNGGAAAQGKRRHYVAPQSTNKVNEDGISECFHKYTTAMYVSLAPMYLNNPINGVKTQHLDPMVMNYFSKAKGVVLSYLNIQIDEANLTEDSEGNPISIARVEGNSPMTFFWINVDLLIWKPQIGDTLEGYIYMQTASHIGLLIHDTFNASIKKYNVPAEWQFIPSQEDETTDDTERFRSYGYWVDENENKVEGKLRFTIKSIHSAGRVVLVEGTLVPPGAEKEAQPVYRERRSSSSHKADPAPSQHKKFDDDDDMEVTEAPELNEDDEIVPLYTADDEDDVTSK